MFGDKELKTTNRVPKMKQDWKLSSLLAVAKDQQKLLEATESCLKLGKARETYLKLPKAIQCPIKLQICTHQNKDIE